jgi:hypothetical protein
LRASTEFNEVILALGLGMAALIEHHCNRKFLRAVGDTEIFTADAVHFSLPRFPVESVTKIELKQSEAEGWLEQTVNEFVRTINLKSGFVYLPEGSDPGDYATQIRFTYTGGYFWEQLENNDVGYPTAQPAGSTALPHDVRLAWLLQCQDVWQRRDNLGTDLARSGKYAPSLSESNLLPLVKVNLRAFVRESWV